MMKTSGQTFGSKPFACRLTGVFLTCMLLLLSSASIGSVPDTVIRKNANSETFYDSVYHKFSKNSFTKFLYALAFKNPSSLVSISDTAQVKKSESPFRKYKGKIIRSITIISVDPFVFNYGDTAYLPRTGIAQALNDVHISTYNYVIRKNLLIKKGEAIDPDELADNERILRNLPYIGGVKTLIHEKNRHADSVDVTIITKDVWSIGFDILTITSSMVRMRLFDANFLGYGDRLSLNFSFASGRPPFFMLEGATYQNTNFLGSFIDTRVAFNQDETGSQHIEVGAGRSFYANKTKWAGGISAGYHKSIEIEEDSADILTYHNNQSLWLGRALFLRKENRPTRLVILEALNRRQYTSRPPVTIDTNRQYYDVIQILTGFAYSRNNFYISDYFSDFGRIENIPYGNLFQLNFGPELSSPYTRFYSGFAFSGGNFFKKFGYFAATFSGGGYLYQGDIEDATLKFNTRYITPAIFSPDHRYKFRTYIISDFRMGFKQRNNNKETFSVNQNFEIENFKTDSIFLGTKSLTFTFASVLFTPWYFYGFRFALRAQLQGGWVAGIDKKLFNQPFYTGTGLGIMTKNDNLIFPTVILSLFYYPGTIPGVQDWQIRFIPDAVLHLPDFNPIVPHTENVQN